MSFEEYIETVHGTAKFASLLINEDTVGLFALINHYAKWEVENTFKKADLKLWTLEKAWEGSPKTILLSVHLTSEGAVAKAAD